MSAKPSLRRMLLLTPVGVLVSLLALVASAQQATAAPRSGPDAARAAYVQPYACTAAGGDMVCVYVYQDVVYAQVEVFLDGDPNFHNPTVALFQCSSGNPNSCGNPTASRSDLGHLFVRFATATRPFSAGHYYRAVASWTDSRGVRHTNIGTPLKCCPTMTSVSDPWYPHLP